MNMISESLNISNKKKKCYHTLFIVIYQYKLEFTKIFNLNFINNFKTNI